MSIMIEKPQDIGSWAADLQLRSGVLPCQLLSRLAGQGIIQAPDGLGPRQIQPASLDLTLGSVAYRIRASFLPGKARRVSERLDDLAMHKMDLTGGAVLETGCVYLVPLRERLALPETLSALANPKSSTGRLDVFTRLIFDQGIEFDRVPAGYQGPLYAEISPRTFSILVRTGSSLNQLRLRLGTRAVTDQELMALQESERLVEGKADIREGLALSVDLSAKEPGAPIGYRARRHSGVIDIDKAGGYAWADYWEPMHPVGGPQIVLDPDAFYILASKEAVRVPPDHAAEMIPFDPLMGEFRVHYAGFFDPGFGHDAAQGSGSRGVLEVRSREVPFVLEDGQPVGRLLYEPMAARPERLYGAAGSGSHYQRQGLKLSKHFV